MATKRAATSRIDVESMTYDEYQQRRKALKREVNKNTATSATNILIPLGQGFNSMGETRVLNAQLDELEKAFTGEEYDERILTGDVQTPPPMGYRWHWCVWQLWAFVLGFWTLGLANYLAHKKFREKYPKDQRI
jgi:hypothetical protein